MGTLVFGHTSEPWSPHEQSILKHAFEACCDIMELTDKEFEVELAKDYNADPSCYGMTGQKTRHHNKFLVLLNTNGWDMFDAMSCFCHEMVHVNQQVTGEEVDGESGVTWHGKFFPCPETPYPDRPWEQQAFNCQGLLTAFAMIRLPKQELDICDPHKSHGLVTYLTKFLESDDYKDLVKHFDLPKAA